MSSTLPPPRPAFAPASPHPFRDITGWFAEAING
jgi:hypothetical protein